MQILDEAWRERQRQVGALGGIGRERLRRHRVQRDGLGALAGDILLGDRAIVRALEREALDVVVRSRRVDADS